MSHSDWWSLGIPENTGDSPMMQRLAKNAVLYLTTDAAAGVISNSSHLRPAPREITRRCLLADLQYEKDFSFASTQHTRLSCLAPGSYLPSCPKCPPPKSWDRAILPLLQSLWIVLVFECDFPPVQRMKGTFWISNNLTVTSRGTSSSLDCVHTKSDSTSASHLVKDWSKPPLLRHLNPLRKTPVHTDQIGPNRKSNWHKF